MPYTILSNHSQLIVCIELVSSNGSNVMRLEFLHIVIVLIPSLMNANHLIWINFFLISFSWYDFGEFFAGTKLVQIDEWVWFVEFWIIKRSAFNQCHSMHFYVWRDIGSLCASAESCKCWFNFIMKSTLAFWFYHYLPVFDFSSNHSSQFKIQNIWSGWVNLCHNTNWKLHFINFVFLLFFFVL